MIRFFSIVIVIVIWGLIVQPLMAAVMPVKMMTDNTHSSMVVAMAADAAKSPEIFQKASCHEIRADESSPKHCDQCDNNCVNASCASSCVAGSSVAAIQKLPVNFGLKGTTVVTIINGARIFGLPSRIFHPPKHA